MKIHSKAFNDNGHIPHKYAGDGENISPPLEWEDVPPNAKELALVVEDPDAPQPQPFVHWLVYGIPPETHALPEGQARNVVQGRNTAGRQGYLGPMPPRGRGPHHYHFRLYALDSKIVVERGAGRDELLEKMKGHVLAESETVGIYER